MSTNPLKRKRGSAHAHPKSRRQQKRIQEDDELTQLEQAVAELPPSGTDSRAFSDLPISIKTKQALKKAFFTKMTDIQAKALPLALKGRDVLGAARTGSGKTLAFLIPVLETLYRKKWGPIDGLGALIISPTRELAIQIFEVLRKVGSFHSFSAGLVIGGKNLKDERERLARMNILVATPGRLLQHMDQTVGFETSDLQVLVLDEADRILDMGFAKTINAIVENVPRSRQTLLFSATQTNSVKDLARLSLTDPEYVATQEAGFEGSTPKSLEQHYLVCELPRKLDVLYSFVRTHLKVKAVVFLSSCRQVQFVHETFSKLRPGISLLALHGKQKQTKRLSIFERFTSTQHAFLFATDIAARGLDFPAVDWVIQLDAPEDVDTYIHRVGRTARYEAKGQGLLFLLPSEEEGMLARLESKKVPISKIKVRESKQQSIQNQLQSFAFQDPEVKHLGQKAFVSYVRSVHLHKDKSIFKFEELPLEEFAASLGLPGAPKVKIGGQIANARATNAKKAVNTATEKEGGEQSNGDAVDAKDKTAVRTKYDRMFGRKNQSILADHFTRLVDHEGDRQSSESSDDAASGEEASFDDDEEPTDLLEGAAERAQVGKDNEEDDFITLKRRDHDLEDVEKEEEGPAKSVFGDESHLSKRKLKMGESKKQMLKFKGAPTKLVFDDEGGAHQIYEMQDEEDFRKAGTAEEQERRFLEEEKDRLKTADVRDKEMAREKRREKKLRKKLREKGMNGGDSDDEAGAGVQLAAPEEDDGYVTPDFDLLPTDDEDSPQIDNKRRKKGDEDDGRQPTSPKKGTLDDQEELALRLLQQGR